MKNVEPLLPYQSTLLELPPLKKMAWEAFEELCVTLIKEEFPNEDVRKYLEPGNTQEGIDIYMPLSKGMDGYDEENVKYVFIQCKRVQNFSPIKIKKSVDRFLKGDKTGDTYKFIIAITENLTTLRYEQEIGLARQELQKLEIKLDVWDYQSLVRRLKDKPWVVHTFFDRGSDPIWVRSLCGDLAANTLIPKILVQKLQYINSTELYIERSIFKIVPRTNDSPDWQYFNNKKSATFREIINERVDAGKATLILLLSYAGRGKSAETENLAAILSRMDWGLFPVLIPLRDYTGETIEKQLDVYFKGWKNIGPKNLFLIFDGLDEPTENYRMIFISELNKFRINYQEASIVISSRTNFIVPESQEFISFETYYLCDLNDQDINRYLLSKFSNDSVKVSAFLKVIKSKKFDDKLDSPFYLKHLSDTFIAANETFPNSVNELFEFIIKKKTDSNIKKFSHSIVHFESRREEHRKLICKVALSLEQLGRNYLSEVEFQKIIPNKDDRELLNHSFLFNKSREKGDSWEFEHNNFQEYIAATAIANLNIEVIKKLTGVFPNQDRLKPKWQNTVSFLFSILDKSSPVFHELFNWIVSKDIELVISFESDRLSKQQREYILFNIVNKYKEREMWVGASGSINANKLIHFSGKSKSILNFLLQQIKEYKLTPLGIVIDCLIMLSDFQVIYGKEVVVKNSLMSLIEDPNFNTSAKCYALECLINIGLLEIQDVDKIILENPDVNHHTFREGLYEYIEKYQQQDYFANFLIEGIKILDRSNKKNNIFHSGYQLQELLLGIQNIDSLVLLARFLFGNKKENDEEYFEYDDLNHFHERLIKLLNKKYSDNPELVFDCILEILEENQKRYIDKNNQILRDFFVSTKTTVKAFERLYLKESRNIIDWTRWNMPIVATKPIIDNLLLSFKQEMVSKEFMKNFLASVRYKGMPELHTCLYEELLQLNHEFFVYNYTDWDLIRENQKQRNFELMLDENEFRKACKRVFDEIGKEELISDDLYNYEYRAPKVNTSLPDNTIAIDYIRRFTERKNDTVTITLDAINSSLDGGWENYIFNRYYHKILNKAIIPDNNVSVIKKWYSTKIDAAIFQVPARPYENYQFYYHIHNLYLVAFYCAFKFPTDVNKVLEMLYYDFGSMFNYHADTDKFPSDRYSDVIVESIEDKSLVRETVLANLKREGQFRHVLESHIRLCAKLKIEVATWQISNLIKSRAISEHCIHDALEVLFELNAEIDLLDDLLENENLKSHWHYTVLNRLIDVSETDVRKFIPLLKSALSEENLNGDAYYNYSPAQCLIKLGEIDGWKYYANVVVKDNRNEIPFKMLQYVHLVNSEELLGLINEMLITVFRDTERFSGRDYSFTKANIIGLLDYLGCINQKNFELVSSFYKKFIKKNLVISSKVKELHTNLESFEKMFYNKQHNNITIDMVLRLNAEIFV